MTMLLLLESCENEGGYSSRVVLFIISFGGLSKFSLGYLIILLASRYYKYVRMI